LSEDLLVWHDHRTLWGYDLHQDRPFVVSRAIGTKQHPLVSGRTVAWVDGRADQLGKWIHWFDLYTATLAERPSPLPPVYGAPASAEGWIRRVWPLTPYAGRNFAEVEVVLVQPGTHEPVPCQWDPPPLLWIAVNDEPAEPITGIKWDWSRYPIWRFTVDITPLRDPETTMSLYVGVDGVPTRTNVWTLTSQAPLRAPAPVSPDRVEAGTGPVEPRWQALDLAPDGEGSGTRLRAAVAVFERGSQASVPLDFDRPVILYGGADLEVVEPLATGHLVVRTEGELTYPVWEFPELVLDRAPDALTGMHLLVGIGDDLAYSTVAELGGGVEPTVDRTQFSVLERC
jgi:hypothetical protein